MGYIAFFFKCGLNWDVPISDTSGVVGLPNTNLVPGTKVWGPGLSLLNESTGFNKSSHLADCFMGKQQADKCSW